MKIDVLDGKYSTTGSMYEPGGPVEAHLPRPCHQLSLHCPLPRHHSLDNPLQVVCACSVSLDLSVQEIWQG